MPDSGVRRRQIQHAVLRWMYEHLLRTPSGRGLPGQQDLEDFDWQEVQYEMRRLDGDGFLEGERHMERITARGIEYLQDLGGGTILEGHLRQAALATLYEADRHHGPSARHGSSSVAEALSEPENVVSAILHYLEDSGLIEVESTMGSRFRWVRITARGMAKHEAVSSAGGDWAVSTTSPTASHEFVFGPGEESQAARLLRDITEVARREILIVDPYARAGIVSRLCHVPVGVKVRILTGDSMVSENYASALQACPKLDVEIRALPRSTLQFHDRYIVVDHADAWAWGHSFHDGGKSKHTVAQIRPVNRDRVLADFENKWPTAQVLV